MRTLFVGAGAVGGYFGGRLAEAGRDVTFLVRPPRASALAENGLRIRGVDGGLSRIAVRTVTAQTLDGPYDIVVLAVKAFGLESALEDAAPAIGPDTVIVPFLNGIRHLESLTRRFGTSTVYGGVCYVATELDRDGAIVQLNGLQSLGYGPLAAPLDDRALGVRAALSGAGFDSELSETIEQDMWEKWVFLAGIGAVTTLMRADVGQVNRAEGGRRFTRRLTEELLAIAAAAGFPPRADALARVERTLGDAAAPTTSSLYRDLLAGSRLESDQIIGDLVARANALGVPAPLLALVLTGLDVYEAVRRAGSES